jgi:hypothetical protein
MPRVPTYKGRYNFTEIIGNVVLINMGFHRRKTRSRNLPQFGHAPSKRFASPDLCQQILRGNQIISLPVVLTSWANHMVTSCRKMP